jgi:hypothetical protein
MLKKFKRIQDRQKLYFWLGKATGKNPKSIESHWFTKLFCNVPKQDLQIAEEVLDAMIEHEKDINQSELKRFAKFNEL